MPRLADERAIIPLWEPLDLTAGADSESFTMAHAAEADIILQFGVITGDTAVLTVYTGATAAAKTTKLAFTYKVSGADYSAANSDLFGAWTTDADGDLTLTAATFESRIITIHINAEQLPAGHTWVTLAVTGTTANVASGIAILNKMRYQPPATQI